MPFIIKTSQRALWILLLGYCGLVLLGTLAPFNFTCDSQILMNRREPIEWIPFSYVCPHCGYNIDNKVLNFFMLLPFGFLFALQSDDVRGESYRIGIAAIGAFCFSLCIEILQYFLPGRTPSASDLLLNALGGLLGAILAIKLFRLHR